jgi:hypothetical protein
MRREIAQGHHGGQRGEYDEHDTECLYQIADTPREWRREQPDSRAGAKHEPKLLGRQPTRAQKGR